MRRLGVRDLDACLDLAEDRGWGREDAKWRLLLELGGGYGVDASDGGLAGTVFHTEVAPGIGAIGMLLVARRHAGRGLGRRLMEVALGAAGDTAVFLYATDLGRPLYAKLGFRVVDRVVPHTGVFRPSGSPASSGVREATPADRPDLTELDRRAFGADRSDLLRWLPRFADRVVLGRSGYAATWDNLGTAHVGPMAADAAHTAHALLDAVLTGTTTARVDLHSASAAVLAGWLAARGLTAQRSSPLMVRGRDLPANRAMLYAPLMQALG